MHGVKNIISDVECLPIEERAEIADFILKSLNRPDNDIDNTWIKTSKNRLDELRKGRIKAVPGEEVFSNIWKRFE